MSEDYKFNPSTGEFEKKTNRSNKSNAKNGHYKSDQGIGLWGIPFLFFPYIGIIVYFFIRDTKPNKAKSILYWSIAGGVLLFISIIDH